MKNFSGVAAAVLILCGTMEPARAQEKPGQLGLGVNIGVPLGFSGKYLIDRTHAVDVAFGAQNSDFDAHADFLTHWRDIPQKKWHGAPYGGMGVKLKNEHNALFGLRLVGGACVIIPGHPLEFLY